MGSMAPSTMEKNPNKIVVSQVSFGGFDDRVTAKELADFLESAAGMIWRCRLKTSWTPPESYPDFAVDAMADNPIMDDFMKVPPHAFVHFALPDAAKRAINAAGKCNLILNTSILQVNSGADTSSRIHRRRTIDPFKFPDVGVEIGDLVTRDEFYTAWRSPKSGVNFIVDPFDGRCRIMFSKNTAFAFKERKEVVVIKCDFKLEFLAMDIGEIKLYMDRAPFVMFIQLSTTPWVSYRTADDDVYASVPYNLLDDDDPWIRTTDFTPGGAIGRCHCYRISLSPRYGAKLERALRYMRERRIPDFKLKQAVTVRDEAGFGVPVKDHFFCLHSKEGINFATLFLVNALVHKGIVSPHQLTEDFFDVLRSQSDLVNDRSLRHIWAYKRPIFDACKRLKLVQEWLGNNPKLLKAFSESGDYVEVRRLLITPTKAHCLPPEIELSNRVLRRYKVVADRFLRVTFMDEGMEQLNNNVLNYYVAPIVRDITSTSFQQRTTVFRRLRSILNDGFSLCGRKYFFLAFSSNQLRDRSAWFFADDGKKTTTASIRSWMGKFNIKNVAKCAARMGQCFSSTYATVNVLENETRSIPDIEANNYVFSDGIGKITPDLAMEVAEILKLSEDPPSAFQIRYAGCKGVVAVWPGDNDGIRLSVRPSMSKFESNHTMLEVISWTRFQPGFLNRQIITLLSTLMVPDKVFAEMQDTMISKLNQMLVDTNVALEILSTSCSEEQGSIAAMMLSAGFKPQTEPHLKGMLSCIRSAQLGDLLAKARIFVPKGRWLMGCLDELGVLEQGQCFVQASTPSLGNCLSKHGSRFSQPKSNRQIVTGLVVIAKNPCLHPGDVRILEAIDVPELHHLVDCLVFPPKGDRPHANEASGSDLDGDLYFVTWDENLIPPSKKSWTPMNYTPAEPKFLTRQVTSQDIIDFYLKNMVNENLGVICNAHVVHADCSENGALDDKCIHLAELAALAVDFPKTGKLVVMPHDLKPKVYPDFMGKDEFLSYKSEKILGRLYRNIKDVSDKEAAAELSCTYEDLPYDTDLEVPGAWEYFASAWHFKCSYDGQLNALLGEYRVSSEGEVVTGHVWSLPKYTSRKQGELKERLKNAYSSLHKEFRRNFELTGPDSELTDDEKDAFYEKKASAWYQVTYHPRWVKKAGEMKEPEGNSVPTRLSFAWIASDYLVRIKVKKREAERHSEESVDSLAKLSL